MVRPAALARETPRASSEPLDSCTASRRPARSAAARPAARQAHGTVGRGEGMSSESNVGRAAGRAGATAGSAYGHHCRGCPGWTEWEDTKRLWQVAAHAPWGLQPLGKGFHQSPGVAGIPRASPACGRLGADRVDTAPGQREGCRALGSSGIFSPAASVLPPAGPGPGKPLTRAVEGKG